MPICNLKKINKVTFRLTGIAGMTFLENELPTKEQQKLADEQP